MTRLRAASCLIALLFVFACSFASPQTATPGLQSIEFFETRVRPALANNCFSCHGETKQEAGLRLDSREAMLRGAASGRVVLAPGDPEQSALARAIRHDGPIKMPPTGKLPQTAIDAVVEWIRSGAVWPETMRQEAGGGRQHWAFAPIKNPPVPGVGQAGWVKTAIDRFILAKLEAARLKPAPLADRRALIRRATFDLVGLPPTYEEVETFAHDASPNAWERVIDRLLAAPRYGERWGRYWLDVARYADTKGYLVGGAERRYPYSYTYRDWVVDALNDDVPYDRFLTYQIAADRLDLQGAERKHLAAMGFLTVGRRFINNQQEIIDDRIDVVCRGTMALTVQCARCHDHKFDPIPTKDYYSLYGVFASSVEPGDLPLIGEPERTAEYLAFETELKAREGALQRFKEEKRDEYLAELRTAESIATYLLAARDPNRLRLQGTALATRRDFNPFVARRWRQFLDETAKSHHPIFAPWHAFSALSEAELAAQAPALASKFSTNAAGTQHLNALVARAFAGAPPASIGEVAQRYGELLNRFQGDEELRDADQDALRQALVAIDAPLAFSLDDVPQLITRADRERLTALQRPVEEWRATSSVAPPRAMVLVDARAPTSPVVFVRGNPNNRGPSVPRQFLGVVAGEKREPFKDGSGRLELARAIASRDNPLTARVMVNRVWMHHFGQPLVRTPGDFGLRSDPPTHPALLDWLASRFMDDGWSLKRLHRLIMISAVYQQSSDGGTDAANTLLDRFPRRRLDFESLRDSLLVVAGKLDLAIGGKSVDITQSANTRRSVYAYVDRQNLPNLFRTFDFASPDTSSPQRHETTVPQQALFMMNSPLVIAQARAVAARVSADMPLDSRVRSLYRLLYSRNATDDEVVVGLAFVHACATSATSSNGLTPWEKYAQALLLANEFVFVD